MKLTRKQFRNLISEMYHSRRDAAFSRAQARYDAMTPYDDGIDRPSEDAPPEEVIETLIENDFLESMIEEIAEEDTPHLIWSDADETYTDNKGNLIARYVKEPGPSGRIYDLLEIVNMDAAEDIVREYYLSEGIPERYYDAFDEIVLDNLRNDY